MAIRVLVISDYRNYHSARPEAAIFIGLAKLGFEITIATYKSGDLIPQFEEVGIKIIDWHPEKKFDKGEIEKIRQLVREENIDILHVFNSPSTVNGIQAAKGLDVKLALYRGFTGHIHWYDPSAYFKYLHPRVDQIFCNSIGVKELIDSQKLFGKKNTTVINKGHDVSWYDGYEAYDIKKELGIPEDSFLLVNVANNRKMKGIPYLLKGFNLLPEDANIHLLLVGNGMDDAQNMRIINAGHNKEKIHLLGFRTNVLNIVKSCDVFVLSSLFGESITKSVIEAMSLEVTPVITDIPGNVELVNHGENGLVVRSKNSSDISEAVLKLYNDRELCKTMGVRARKHIATNLNTENTVLKTKKMYEDLIAE